MRSRKLESEILALLDGELPPDRAEALRKKLAADQTARKRYYQYVGLHQALVFRLAGSQSSGGPSAEDRLRAQRRRGMQTALAVSAAALVIAALFLRAFLVPDPKPLAVLHRADGTRFSIDGGGEDGSLVDGSAVRLSQGTLEVLLATGSRAVVQAPAGFRLKNRRHFLLDQGSAFFHVEKEDVGFTVETAGLRIVDLGTDFGIHARESGNPEVHVLRGSVRVDCLRGRKEGASLGAGEARRADPVGRLQTVDFDAGAFPTKLPPGLPDLHFTFDGSRGPDLPVGGSLPKAESIHASYIDASGAPAVPTLIPGKVGRAIRFKGDGDHVLTDWQGLEGDLPRSVSFWVKVEKGASFIHLPAVVNWGDPEAATGKWKVLLAQESPTDPVTTRISLGLIAYDGRTPMNDGEWHHVVAVFSRSADGNPDRGFAIYVDGRPENLRRRQFAALDGGDDADHPDTLVHTARARPLLLGLSIEPRPGSFAGCIDDLRIHAGALSAEEVTSLFSETE